MLKRLFAILSLAIYLPAIAGIGFSTHYCEGERQETEIFSYSKKACCTENPEEDDCCSDHIEIVKLDKDQLSESKRLVLKSSQFSYFIPEKVYFHVFNPFKGRMEVIDDDSPPLPDKNLPVLYCQLII